MRIVRMQGVAAAMILLAAIPAGGAAAAEPASDGSVLAFERRLAAHRVVEEVYWRHRLWPAENRTPKPSLDSVMPHSLPQGRAEDALRLSNALEAYWGSPITGAQLQAEIERQARDSQQPAVLHELWQALGNDPYVVAEILARPVLAERLARSSFALDRRFAGLSFESWWRQVRPALPLTVAASSHEFTLPALEVHGSAAGGTWTPTFALPEAEVEATAVWTGTEMIVWGGTTEGGGGKFNSGSRYDPALDTWRPTSAVGAPMPRKQHTAVWTGTEMIVWGGCGQLDEHNCEIDTGGRYDPATDTWAPTTQVNAPGQRMDHTAIWTGTEMIVWGGCAFVNDDCQPEVVGNDGGRYDPATDSWADTALANAPSGRHFHTAVWTSTEMIVWGGQDDDVVFNTGGRYDPAADSWTPTTTAGAPSKRWDHTAVWTGNRMIVWGGCPIVTFCSNAVGTGGQYTPAMDQWRPLQQTGAPDPRGGHTAVWTGREMIVWGGCSGNFCGTFLDTGGRYRPRSDSWTPTSQMNAPQPRTGHLAVWTGSLMVVWGGDRVALYGSPRTGGRYDPRSDTWTPTNASEAPSARYFHTLVWTGAEMIVWGGDDRIFGTIRTGGRYTPATDSWQPTSLAGAPSARASHSAVWTGTEMIVWGGQYGSEITRSGRRYNPLTDTWVPTATAGAPAARSGHSAVWTGTEMIVWGGSGNPLWMGTGGRYNPSTDSWVPTATAGAPRGRDDHSAVWTGTEMIVWGGYSNGSINSGGRYDPATNSWTPTSRSGEPSPRSSHAAVWTGSEMLIWGGWQYDPGLPDLFNDGARYDPVSDSWSPITLTSAPTRRSAFAYVWTGAELIVWGGSCFVEDPGCDFLEAQYTGGQYDPAADRWIPTTTVGAPGPIEAVLGVWTGTEMIVWGGLQSENSTLTHNGGRYVPIQGEDVTPPVISEVAATDVGEDSATIVWTTDEGATSQVEYGLTPDYGSITELDPNLVLDHGVVLTDLDGVTLYHFRVRSIDASGNESVSGDFTLRTIDTVAITSAEQCWMSELLWVRATGTDPTATLTVHDTNGGEFIGELTNLGDGSYRGKFDWAPILSQIDVISSSGGMATRVVAVGSC